MLPSLTEPIRASPVLLGTLAELVHTVKDPGLKALVAKCRESRYELGERSGA